MPLTHNVDAGMVESVDRGVGVLLDKIESLGIRDKTIVVYMSDNGGEPEFATGQQPFKQGKGYIYEGGIRVPLIIAHPGVLHPGASDFPVLATDLFPTILELAGECTGSGMLLAASADGALCHSHGPRSRMVAHTCAEGLHMNTTLCHHGRAPRARARLTLT